MTGKRVCFAKSCPPARGLTVTGPAKTALAPPLATSATACVPPWTPEPASAYSASPQRDASSFDSRLKRIDHISIEPDVVSAYETSNAGLAIEEGVC